MAMGIVGGLGIVLAVARAFTKNLKVFGTVPLRVVQVMGRLKSDFLGDFGHRFFHVSSLNFWAMGIRRPIPKALVVTFRPGAIWRRLYSFWLIFPKISRTKGASKPAFMILEGGWFSSTYNRKT